MLNSRKRKKTVKMRGSNSHGYGYKKKHRGKGSKGGKGMAGSFKQNKSWIFRFDRSHLGKPKGFKSIQKKLARDWRQINLRDVQKLMEKNNLKDEIDLGAFGYNKVLSSGDFKKPVSIKASMFSKQAEEKIQKSGGKAIKI